MPKISVQLDLKQLEKMINQLKSCERITLLQRLEHQAWGERLRSVTARADRRRKKYPVSQKELLSLVKEARRERYAARRS